MSSRLRSKFAVNLTIGFFATSNLCRNSGAATALARYGRPSPDRQLPLSLSDCSGYTRVIDDFIPGSNINEDILRCNMLLGYKS